MEYYILGFSLIIFGSHLVGMNASSFLAVIGLSMAMSGMAINLTLAPSPAECPKQAEVPHV